MFVPFKGYKGRLSRDEYHWNFVQSSTRMCVERVFGMLKGEWRILLKMIDMHMNNVRTWIGEHMPSFTQCLHHFQW